MSVYLYGVLRPPARVARELLGMGVGNPPAPVYLLRHRDLAAAVSDVEADAIGEAAGARALRRDISAHSAALNRLLGAGPVLPARFGIVLPDERTVFDRLLETKYELLSAQVRQVSGAVELRVKADYLQDQVIEKVVTNRPQLARAARVGGGYQQKIDLGRNIAAAVGARSRDDEKRLLDHLRPGALGVAVREPAGEMNVLNASFLVAADFVSRFDRRLETLQSDVRDTIRLDCVGPLPPYSFVDLRL